MTAVGRRFALIAGLLILGGASNAFAEGSVERSAEPAHRLQFVFVPSVDDSFDHAMERGMKEAAGKHGVDLSVSSYPKSWGPEIQVPILDAALAPGNIDLVIIAPTSSVDLVAPLKRAYDEGSEIITVDTHIGDGDYSKPGPASFPLSLVASDDELGGRLSARALADAIGGQRIGLRQCHESVRWGDP